MSGLSGYQLWPSVASVELTQPEGAVILRPVPEKSYLYATVGGITYAKINGVVTIPAEALVDAASRRLVIRIVSSKGQYGGTLAFLPEDESEQFLQVGAVNKSTGRIEQWESYRNTGFVDVQFVSDITLHSYVVSDFVCALYGYDDNYDPVRVIVEKTDGVSDLHIIPDGSYRYVIATNNPAGTVARMILHRIQD